MLENNMLIIIEIVGLLIMSFMLLRYWMRFRNLCMREGMSGLRLSEKIAFSFGEFCERICQVTGFKKTKLEEGFGKQKLL